MKIRTRLLLFNVALMAVTVLTLTGTFYVFGEQYLYHSAIDEISRSSRQALLIVERFFETRLAEQRTLSKSTFFFRNLDYDQIQMRFEDYRHNFQTYHSISFFDAQRVRRIDLNRLDLNRRTTSDALFDRALVAPGPVYEFDVSNPMRPMVRFVSKVQQGDAAPIGYVVATVPLTTLQRTLIALAQPIAVRNRADVQLYSRDGARIYSRLEAAGSSATAPSTRKDFVKKPIRLTTTGLSEMGSPYEGLLYETSDEFSIVFERETDQNDLNSWKLAFRVSKDELERPIILLRKMMLAIFAALFLIAIALNRWLTQSLLLPIENLTASMQSYNMGTVDTTIDDLERNDEIGVLTRGVHDLTERMKKNFAELSTTSKFVALGEMAAGIAHEINNPLTVIMGKASMLDKNEKVDSTLVRDSSVKIIEMVHRITRTIHALRVYARSGDNDAVGVESVQTIINSTLDICLERLRLSSIHLDVVIDPPDAVIIARPVQVSQILMNLLNNAHDAIMTADRGGAKPLLPDEKWIRLTVRENETHVLIVVENGGPRISNEVAERLFEPFFTTKPSGVGTGLGLTISQRLATANRATIRFDSSKPFTQFVLEFPRPDVELLEPLEN